MPRVVHFDLSADDPDRAIKFYQSVFGWKIEKWKGPTDYWLVSTGDADELGIDGSIVKRTDPARTTANIIHVPSVDEYAELVKKHGGGIIEPKKELPGIGYLIMCRDTEGNVFGIIEIADSVE
ncbi:MAG: VOC family protein [Deltaproteobacteria bacterium]|nr:VOC family protein [Deltaproteobacteria bacterium]